MDLSLLFQIFSGIRKEENETTQRNQKTMTQTNRSKKKEGNKRLEKGLNDWEEK